MNTPNTLVGRLLLALVFTLSTQFSLAAVPDGIHYQAYLTDDAGSPIDSDISITFAAYTVDVGGVPLWSQTELVSVDTGLFSVVLGNPGNPFPPNLFDTPVFIGLFVAGEEMLPRRALSSSPYSYKAADADTLTGFTSTDLDQSSEVASLDASVSGLQSDLTTTQGNLASLSNDVSTNTSGIASNTVDIATNDGRLSTLEATGGDITSVTVGAGLTGGALSGNAPVALAAGGVSTTFLADNAVTGAKIADGSIGAEDIDSNDSYIVNGLQTNGTTTIGGSLTVDSTADIRINDNFNGFRWYSTDGSTQYASIEVREADATFRDNVRGRAIFRSNSNGIGIGTLSPVNTHAVTLPGTAFTGNIDIGLERVTTSYTLSSMSASCHSHGNLQCYYGSGSVTCPVGKRVIGGGTSGSSGLFGSIAVAAPVSDTTFSCGASYDIANATRTCYAICANID